MKKSSTSVESPKPELRAPNVTIGMDLGDKTSRYCMLDESGQVLRESSVATSRKRMTELFARLGRCRVAIEVGTHSPWLSRLLKNLGHEVIVANARQVKLLSRRGPDTDLKRWGLKLCERGGKNAKKRALVAVARKLAILLHRLWATGEVYEPLRNCPAAACKAAA